MEFQDKVLKCIDCGTDFIFTAGEQLFFHDKQFKNEPKRCKACKGKRISVLGAPPVAGQNYRYRKFWMSCHASRWRSPRTPVRGARAVSRLEPEKRRGGSAEHLHGHHGR